MPKERQLEPKLRFPEFNYSWKIKTIGDYYKNLRTGMTPYRGKPEFYDGNIPWITSGELNYNIINKTKETITKEAVEETNLRLYPANTLFIAITGLEAPGTRGKCALNGVPATTNQSCMAFQEINEIDNMFMFYWYNKHGVWLYYRFAQGTKQQSFNNKIVDKFEFIHPKLEEQQKIADFLSSVDTHIQTLEKKKKALELYKKGVTQKIFKQEIRFKDDDGNAFPGWEKRKLNHFLSIPDKVTPNQIDPKKILTVKLHLKGVHLNERTDSLKIGSTKYIQREKGQFLYGKQNLFNGAFAILPEKFDGYLSSGDVPALDIDNSKIDSKFFYYFLARSSFYNRLESIASGSGSKRIHEKTLLQLKIKLPNLVEQTKIANFLSAIDEQIQGITQQIEHTKTYKKGLLQQMFV